MIVTYKLVQQALFFECIFSVADVVGRGHQRFHEFPHSNQMCMVISYVGPLYTYGRHIWKTFKGETLCLRIYFTPEWCRIFLKCLMDNNIIVYSRLGSIKLMYFDDLIYKCDL